MKTLQEIKNERQEKQTELFNKVGLFFAFSNEQFNENKTPLNPGEKYVSIGAGGYLPKGNLDEFLNGMEFLNKWEKEEIKNAKQQEAEILHELYNYECFYVGSPQEAIERLPQYSPEKIRQIYNKNFKKAMANL